jgi:hypothetical protein
VINQVYSKDVPEFAVKRLLLENVLLLGSRRVPMNEIYDLAHAEVSASEPFFLVIFAHFNLQSVKVIKETFGKPIRKIFQYYLNEADKRRNQTITIEKMQQKELRNATNMDLTEIAASRQQILQGLRDSAKLNKEYINYREYMQVSIALVD